MPRPKKDAQERRDQRLTVYLSEQEQTALRDIADQQQRSMTQVMTDALRDWLMRLIDPPESLRQARYERISNETSLTVRGYACARGHVWWVDWAEPMDPRYCPQCGSQREIKRIWGGTVKRGL